MSKIEPVLLTAAEAAALLRYCAAQQQEIERLQGRLAALETVAEAANGLVVKGWAAEDSEMGATIMVTPVSWQRLKAARASLAAVEKVGQSGASSMPTPAEQFAELDRFFAEDEEEEP